METSQALSFVCFEGHDMSHAPYFSRSDGTISLCALHMAVPCDCALGCTIGITAVKKESGV